MITAGIVLFRLAQWFLPIPIGWMAVGLWRRQISKGELPDPFTLPSGLKGSDTDGGATTQTPVTAEPPES